MSSAGSRTPSCLKLLTRWCSSENIADDENLAIEVDILGNTVKTEFDLDMESCSDYHSRTRKLAENGPSSRPRKRPSPGLVRATSFSR